MIRTAPSRCGLTIATIVAPSALKRAEGEAAGEEAEAPEAEAEGEEEAQGE